MVRIILIIVVLFLGQSKAYACSCMPAGVMPISEMLEDYDYVFIARVDEAIDYNNNSMPVGLNKGLNIEELIQNSRKITPAKKAKVTISEVFKGRLEGSVDLNFEAEGGNCAGGYYFEGETTLFFLSDVGEGLVRSAGHCSPSNQYFHTPDQIRKFNKNGTDPKLLSNHCYFNFKKSEGWVEFMDEKQIDSFILRECSAYYEDYKEGKFSIPISPEPK